MSALSVASSSTPTPERPHFVVIEQTAPLYDVHVDAAQAVVWSRSAVEHLIEQIRVTDLARPSQGIVFVNAAYSRVLIATLAPLAGLAHELKVHGQYSPCGDRNTCQLMPSSAPRFALSKLHLVTLDYTDYCPTGGTAAEAYAAARSIAVTNITRGRLYDTLKFELPKPAKETTLVPATA